MDEEQNAALDESLTKMNELTILSRLFEKTVTNAFKSGATQAKGFENALRSVALQLSNSVLKSSLKALTGGIGNAANSLFSNLFGGNNSVAPEAASDVAGFAQGGVFASPRYFSSQNGLGVLGEAGPEAIMPLTRGPDGRLGVAASGGREAAIHVQINTPDATSFLRSEAQVTAALARAVARGRRSL